MKAVLDTNVLVAALRSRSGASRACVAGALGGSYGVLATPSVFFEYETVLKRVEHLAVMGLTASHVDRFLAGLASIIVPVDVSYRWRPQLGDPADEMFLEAAINGKADFIVTFNVRDYLPAAPRFGVGVVGPAAFLRMTEDRQ